MDKFKTTHQLEIFENCKILQMFEFKFDNTTENNLNKIHSTGSYTFSIQKIYKNPSTQLIRKYCKV